MDDERLMTYRIMRVPNFRLLIGSKLLLFFFITNLFAATIPKQHYKKHTAIKTTQFSRNSYTGFSNLPWSLEVGLGHGKYQHMKFDDGNTVLARIGFGKGLLKYKSLLLGLELGVQTGNNSRLSIPHSTQQSLGGLSIDSEMKPMMDLLLSGKLYPQKKSGFFIQAKGGYAYRQWQFTRSSVNDLSRFDPELQVGLGWDVNRIVSLSLSYQRIFGENPNFKIVSQDCIAHVSGIPAENSVLLELSLYLNEKFWR